jgi:ketosteroid isomerase-like protein
MKGRIMSSDNQAEDVAAAEEVIRGVYEAFKARDPARMLSHLHPDVTIWDTFQPHLIRGAAQKKAFVDSDFAQSIARGPLTHRITSMVTSVWGDTAIVRFTTEFSYDPPNPISGRGRNTSVLRRIDGRWLQVHHHEGRMPTGIPPITEPPPR